MMQDGQEKAEIEMVAVLLDRITFASHQNDIPLIADITLRNLSQHDLENLELILACKPALVAEKKWRIDRLSAGTEHRIRDRAVSLAGAILSELNERMRADVTLSVLQGERILCEYHHDLIGLARNEWGGSAYMPELLAAFVMPNDPAVDRILKQTGEVLRKSGKQPSLNGYQSRSRQHVWEMASAIWAALSMRRLVYAEPPASFEREGQKIRTPNEIMEAGLATCLDSTVLFAAALEQAGLNAVIVFTKGHAFCGVWLQPQNLSTLTTDDASELRKHIALKELVLFETTLIINEPPISFSSAIASATQAIAEENEENFVYAIDMRRARSRQITPLGVVIKLAQGTDIEAQRQVSLGLEEAPSLPGFDFGLADGAPPDTPETRLDHWKRKLLDLTKRNRLLNLKESKTAIRLHCFDPAKLEDKLADGMKISVVPFVELTGKKNERDGQVYGQRTGKDFLKAFCEEALSRNEVVSDMSQGDLDAGMVQLYRKAKTDLQEGGANTLYLVLGVLKWKQSKDEERSYRAPLILLPVKLDRRSAASKVMLEQHDDEPVFNMTLLEMLRQDFDLRIPELEGQLPEDKSGIDVPLVWEWIRKAVRDIAGFEVMEEVVLSTFSFTKYLMWKDLAERTEALKKNLFVKHLIDHPRDVYAHSASFMKTEDIDKVIDPSQLFMPLSADSSQIVAVYASAQGGDFILEGPPGTGKSQTIANIITHNLGMGRKVLFVSEKITALNVVYNRLNKIGLGDFCLQLHSNKASKKEIIDQLGKAWKKRSETSQVQWQQQTGRLASLRDQLNGLVHALHRQGATGISPRAAIARLARWQDIHRLRLNWQGGLDADFAKTSEDRLNLEALARKTGQAYTQIDVQDQEIFRNVKQVDWSHGWQSKFVANAKKLAGSIENLVRSSEKFISCAGLPALPMTCRTIKGLLGLAKNLSAMGRHDLSYAFVVNHLEIFSGLNRALDLLDVYRQTKAQLSVQYSDMKILDVDFSDWQTRWGEAKLRFWPIGMIARMQLCHGFKKSMGLSEKPNVENDIALLLQLQSTQKNVRDAASVFPETAPWSYLETNSAEAKESLMAAQALRSAIQILAVDVKAMSELEGSLRKLCCEGRAMLQPDTVLMFAAQSLIKDAEANEQNLANYIGDSLVVPEEHEELAAIKDRALRIIELQPRINTWCRWQAAKQEAEASGLAALVEALENGVVNAADAEEEFKTAYCDWIVGKLIDEWPELKTFSAIGHEDKIISYRALDKEIESLSVKYVRARLSGSVPNPQAPERHSGYGVLAHELQKKMRHKPVRQLLGEMGDALTTLTPCLMMSPLSVAQFLPAGQQIFDLVVFDEASQITVWDAVGAISRGKNVIVVGDPKQMPPSNFFDRASPADGDSDSDGQNFDDLESILDEALAASIKLHRLTGHYRSKHESLIAFSNHRYYGGELVTYPASETRQSAVTFRLVQGQYQRGKGRTNTEEAKEVVTEIVRRLTNPELSAFSIGVVTLNGEQQELIQNLLDDARRQNPDIEPFFNENHEEPVSVYNLESVQGHQRDVILLSVGYGPDTPGAKTMSMNFGPLNRNGGERRLNVAITRATTETIIFASFDPSMIDLTRTSAVAVRDLKHYLEFAQRGPSALGEAVQAVGGLYAYDSDFEEAVAIALRKKGWGVHTQIGVSKFRIDLGIVHPDNLGRYLAGVECDGATYHRSPSARDRDRVRHAVLTSLGWKLLRIWSTDFWIDPVRTIDSIHERLTQLYREENSALQKTS